MSVGDVLGCTQCGKCCHIQTSTGLVPCRYLKKIGNKYWCRVYKLKHRIGMKIGVYDGVQKYCTYYNALPTEIEGCPLNTGTKPLIQVEL